MVVGTSRLQIKLQKQIAIFKSSARLFSSHFVPKSNTKSSFHFLKKISRRGVMSLPPRFLDTGSFCFSIGQSLLVIIELKSHIKHNYDLLNILSLCAISSGWEYHADGWPLHIFLHIHTYWRHNIGMITFCFLKISFSFFFIPIFIFVLEFSRPSHHFVLLMGWYQLYFLRILIHISTLHLNCW